MCCLCTSWILHETQKIVKIDQKIEVFKIFPFIAYLFLLEEMKKSKMTRESVINIAIFTRELSHMNLPCSVWTCVMLDQLVPQLRLFRAQSVCPKGSENKRLRKGHQHWTAA